MFKILCFIFNPRVLILFTYVDLSTGVSRQYILYNYKIWKKRNSFIKNDILKHIFEYLPIKSFSTEQSYKVSSKNRKAFQSRLSY